MNKSYFSFIAVKNIKKETGEEEINAFFYRLQQFGLV